MTEIATGSHWSTYFSVLHATGAVQRYNKESQS